MDSLALLGEGGWSSFHSSLRVRSRHLKQNLRLINPEPSTIHTYTSLSSVRHSHAIGINDLSLRNFPAMMLEYYQQMCLFHDQAR